MLLLTQRFEPEFVSVGLARRAARRALQPPGLAWLQDDVGTLVSELATNAVLHARSVFTVLLELQGASLRISVVDESPVLPRPRRFGDASSTTGRGLQLVAALSSAWGVLSPTATGGKQTWCELSLAEPGDSVRQFDQARVQHGGVAVSEDAVDVDALLVAFDDHPGPTRLRSVLPATAHRRRVLV